MVRVVRFRQVVMRKEVRELQYILMKDVVTVIIAEIFKTQENNG